MATQKNPFIDIHSHFIFEVDDGAKNKQLSLEMLRQAQDNGITQLIATPHATDLTNDAISQQFIKRFSSLKEMIASEKLNIKIILASELYFNPHIYELLKYEWATFDGKGKFLLFELPLYEMPTQVSEFIFHCKLEGITPILAHPERYSYLRKNYSSLLEWHRQGCLMQVNAGSVLGHFGERAMTFSKKIVRSNLAAFIASDAHDTEYRNYSVLKKAHKILSELVSLELLDGLFYENPKCAILGEPIESEQIDETVFEERFFSFDSLKKNLHKVFRL